MHSLGGLQNQVLQTGITVLQLVVHVGGDQHSIRHADSV